MGSISIDVLDLPRLRDEPTFQTLIETLQVLELNPSRWADSKSELTVAEDTTGVSRWLTSIMKNSFDWLQDLTHPDSDGITAAEQLEMLWDLASQRMSERCGRNAMGELSRTWTIPKSEDHPTLNIEIREPPLTGDNLGFKTWGTAWAIAQIFSDFRKDYLSHLLPGNRINTFTTATGATFTQPQTRVLELGAGTGLLGLAAAAVWGANVTMTDLEVIQDNLLFNARKNAGILEGRGVNVQCGVLDWKEPEKQLPLCWDKEFEIVMASDPLYDDGHPSLVAKMIKQHLKPIQGSRAMVAVPMRDSNTVRMASKLLSIMASYGFKILHEGAEICRDDWASDEDEVKCRWWIWGLSGDEITR
ncbi:uncharacterized protein BP5553_08529 [Venustampulla echinocandica]|uniref:S-adenosyl-L-methionine-dependent methyltransferase n=1 Tax=Venustampulla echinocandica TaxID=2656787 RepID=A0A370TEM2_9HELO|nr:uncharacterized protein BP5553_08529 [Venustampulla echinocandica]RDL33090.1 hypothetical protein BP5553_08529 [Venustampulla echinocandica]